MTYQAESEGDRQMVRLVLTLVAAAALIIGAFLDWAVNRTGDTLTVRALVQADFGYRGNFLITAGGVSVLIALVALLGLVDRSGWLTRLTGAAGIVVFVMFTIEAYRIYGGLGTAMREMRVGAWLQLAGGLTLLIAGLFCVTTAAVAANAMERERYAEQGVPSARQPLR